MSHKVPIVAIGEHLAEVIRTAAATFPTEPNVIEFDDYWRRPAGIEALAARLPAVIVQFDQAPLTRQEPDQLTGEYAYRVNFLDTIPDSGPSSKKFSEMAGALAEFFADDEFELPGWDPNEVGNEGIEIGYAVPDTPQLFDNLLEHNVGWVMVPVLVKVTT